ncbi:unnamed protein product [Amaranthus hypochondriacus]
MQDVQQINGVVGGRVLLKHLQQQTHLQQHLQQQQQQQQQALKCPRCDSINTKFCYYNNYNLSQPRHFCKNCRRYWTKGGVLRNVPVGGGCRKSKRSSAKQKSSSSSCSTTVDSLNSVKRVSQNSANNSSSESSTNNNTAANNTVVGGGVGGLFQIPQTENFGLSSDLDNNLFSAEIGGFIGLISENNNDKHNINDDIKNNSEGFSVVDDGNGGGDLNGNGSVCEAATASFSEFLQNQGVQEWDMGKICGVHQEENQKIDFIDSTVRIEDLLQNRGSNVGLASLDWHLTADNNQSLFDVSDNSTIDHQAYWNQSTTATHHHDSQWSDSTTSHLPLFLP